MKSLEKIAARSLALNLYEQLNSLPSSKSVSEELLCLLLKDTNGLSNIRPKTVSMKKQEILSKFPSEKQHRLSEVDGMDKADFYGEGVDLLLSINLDKEGYDEGNRIYIGWSLEDGYSMTVSIEYNTLDPIPVKNPDIMFDRTLAIIHEPKPDLESFYTAMKGKLGS